MIADILRMIHFIAYSTLQTRTDSPSSDSRVTNLHPWMAPNRFADTRMLEAAALAFALGTTNESPTSMLANGYFDRLDLAGGTGTCFSILNIFCLFVLPSIGPTQMRWLAAVFWYR